MNKRGQFYLLATIIIIGLIFSFAAVINFSQEKTSVNFDYLKDELSIESENVIDDALFNNKDMKGTLIDFSKTYSTYSEADNLYFIFGNREGITVAGYRKFSDGKIFIDVGSGNQELSFIKKVYNSRDFINPEKDIKIIVNDVSYDFSLSPGDNFYFSLSKEIKEAFLDVNQAANKSTESIRDIVWFINPMSDRQGDLISRLKETANSMLANIEFNFVSPETESVKKINPEVKRNIYLIFKEILNNIIKHSHASQINIRIKEDVTNLSIKVEDNGVGFEESTVKKGNGLLNLRSRAKQINGKLDIITSLGKGAKITLHLNIT